MSKKTDASLDEIIVKKWQSLSSSADHRGLNFNLSLRKIRYLVTAKKCYYTGIEFDDNVPDLRRSIDRVDSHRDYVDDNVVPCIARFNNLKANTSYRELLVMLKGMKRHYAKHGIDMKLLANLKSKYETN